MLSNRLLPAVILSYATLAAPVATAADVETGLPARAAAGGVRVIVRFAEPATAKNLSDSSSGRADVTHVERLRTIQNGIVAAALPEAAAGVADRHALTLMNVAPMFAATVDATELKRLTADSRVAAIYADRLSTPTLIQSTGIVNAAGATGAWTKGATGKGQIVAVLDTGVDKTHPFLRFDTKTTKVVSEACYNTIDATYGSYSRCPGGATATTVANSGLDCASGITGCGHGTHVAGIAAGFNTQPVSGTPTRGVAYDAAILAIDVFSRFNYQNKTKPCGTTATQNCLLSWDSDQIKALERVYELRGGVGTRKIAAVNLSLGGGYKKYYCDDSPLKPIIDKLRAARIAVVIAAGNNGYVDGISMPGCISSATTVAASTKRASGSDEKVASYSNVSAQVDIFAPGGDFGYPATLGDGSLILSSYLGGYAYLAGTSMAAPHVAGAFAAIRSKSSCAGLSVSQIEAGMMTSGPLIVDRRTGGKVSRHRLDIGATIARVCP